MKKLRPASAERSFLFGCFYRPIAASVAHQAAGRSELAKHVPTITDIGAALEQAAESADADTSRKWVGELSSYLDRVEVIYD